MGLWRLDTTFIIIADLQGNENRIIICVFSDVLAMFIDECINMYITVMDLSDILYDRMNNVMQGTHTGMNPNHSVKGLGH